MTSSHQTSTSSKKRHYLKKWESEFQWLEYDEDPGQCLYDNSSWDSVSGTKLFTDENDQNLFKKLIGRKKSFLLDENCNRSTTKTT